MTQEITVKATTWKELNKLRDDVNDWKEYIKGQKEIDSKIKSLGQKRSILEKKEQDKIKEILK